MLILTLIRLIQEVIISTFGLFTFFVPGVEDGAVTEIPYIQDALDQFSSVMHGIREMLPMTDVIYILLIFGIGIKLAFMMFDLFVKVVGLIRG